MLRNYHASTVMLNATWQPILKYALAKLRKFARSADFDASLKQVFGVEIESTELKQAWLAGNFGTLPNLEIIASSQINNARGAFAAEGNSGTKNANFILSLSNPSTQTISVNYQTVDDDATTANNDYVAKTGTITFTPGQTTQTLPITINGDTSW
jgi:hypothetical protein